MNDKQIILLAGATGYVGGRLRRILENQGARVRCLARRPEFLRSQGDRLKQPEKLTALGASDGVVERSDDPATRARENLVLVLFNHHEFVTVR